MSTISEAVKAARPTLSASSVKTYSSVLGSLYKRCFGAGEVHLKHFDETELIIHSLRDKPASSSSGDFSRWNSFNLWKTCDRGIRSLRQKTSNRFWSFGNPRCSHNCTFRWDFHQPKAQPWLLRNEDQKCEPERRQLHWKR